MSFFANLANREPIRPSLAVALVPVLSTLIILGVQIFYFGEFLPHIPLALGLAITSLVGWLLGFRWTAIQDGAFRVISVALPAIGIIILIGMIIGTWLASGTVPLLIYYGLQVIDPSYFLVASFVLCMVVSTALGTSWTTVGTVGLALVGIGTAFDIPIYWTAGAVVSGAFFGDKMSPLSDTTNLAPAVTETDLFDHIKNMFPTTLVAAGIAFPFYLVAGFFLYDGQGGSIDQVNAFAQAIEENFNLNPLVLLPVILVLALAVLKMPPIPSLFGGVLMAGILAIVFQGASVESIFNYAYSGYKLDTGMESLDSLLNRGGIESMTFTVTLVLIALSFGGALEVTGCMEAITSAILSRVRSFSGLQTTAILSSSTICLVSGDIYLSLVLPGRMYASHYDQYGYSRLNLSRALEEGGTLISPLIPWNVGGAVVISALGLGIGDGNLENLLYIPLAVVCWLSPLIGIFYAQVGWFSPKAEADDRNGGVAGEGGEPDAGTEKLETPSKQSTDG